MERGYLLEFVVVMAAFRVVTLNWTSSVARVVVCAMCLIPCVAAGMGTASVSSVVWVVCCVASRACACILGTWVLGPLVAAVGGMGGVVLLGLACMC